MCKINKPVINVAATAINIKSCRIMAGYTVREIQKIFNFSSPQAIYNWESGKDIPSIDNLIVISSVYHKTIEDILVVSDVEVECEIGEKSSA